MKSIAEKLAANAGPKCCICEKTVFKPEEVSALGKIWHKKCFQCSSTEKNGCQKVLSIMEGYLVREERTPYCKSCYNKLYAPRGVNSACKETAVYTSTGAAGAAIAASEPAVASQTSSNFVNTGLATKVAAAELSSEPPRRRVSGGAAVFEGAASAASPAKDKDEAAPAVSRTSLGGSDKRGNAGSTVVGTGASRVEADLEAAKEAYRLQREADMAAANGTAGSKNAPTTQHDKSLPVNSVFAAANAHVSATASVPTSTKPQPAAAGTAYRSAGATQGSASTASDAAPKAAGVASIASKFESPSAEATAPKTGGVASIASKFGNQGGLSTAAPAPVKSAPKPLSAPTPAYSAPAPAPAAVAKAADNVVPTPVVFAAAVAGASGANDPKRRGSVMGVGGNLKHEVHKEKGAILDGDEVHEGEWD